jgi:hypothetical protein
MSALFSNAPPPSSGIRGGRLVTAKNVNAGNLRCPVCDARMLSKTGTLTTPTGPSSVLHIPRPKSGADDKAKGSEQFDWETQTFDQWWAVPDVDCFDNVGMSREVQGPAGLFKIVLCSQCQQGPFGYQLAGESKVWVPCDLMVQQEASLADDKVDFPEPTETDPQIEQLRAMMSKGTLTTQFKVDFEGQRLCMMLNDIIVVSDDGLKEEVDGVQVVAFTSFEGKAGPVELGGDVKLGDRVVRVDGESTKNLGFEAVLEMIIGAERPIQIMFERRPGETFEGVRMEHSEYESVK